MDPDDLDSICDQCTTPISSDDTHDCGGCGWVLCDDCSATHICKEAS